jgi:hypothetical protein
MFENKIVRVEGQHRRFYAVEPAKDQRGGNWWCLHLRKGQPDWTRGWRAFHESKMEIA